MPTPTARTLLNAAMFLDKISGAWVFENTGVGWYSPAEDGTPNSKTFAESVVETAVLNGWDPPVAVDREATCVAFSLEFLAQCAWDAIPDWAGMRTALREAGRMIAIYQHTEPEEATDTLHEAERDFLYAHGWREERPTWWREPFGRRGRVLPQGHAVNSQKLRGRDPVTGIEVEGDEAQLSLLPTSKL